MPTTFEYVELSDGKVYQTENAFTDHILWLSKSNKYCATLGMRSKSFPDAWLLAILKDSNDYYVIYIQSKRREKVGGKATPGANKFESVEEEHKKCTYLPNRHIFVFITDNKSRYHEKFKSNEIVITSDDHENFYGSLLAMRKLYCDSG